MTERNQPRAAYVHVPFCARRCGYCNFTLVAGRDDLVEPYLDAVEQELGSLGGPHEVDTLFFGGGTPTHLRPEQLARLLRAVLRSFPLAAGHEFSIEANPSDLDSERIGLVAESGVNRISLGAQSFDAAKLRFLDRDHSAHDIARGVELARGRIDSVSIDLIFGVPGESLEDWTSDLAAAIALEPAHVSTYGLTYERGTALWTRWRKGDVRRLGEETDRAMFERAIDTLTAAGFEHYEVSNFARPGHRCRHNEVYWAGGEYFAVGPGAARYVGGRREVNHRSTTTYIRRMLAGQSPVAESETLSPEDRARETLVIGLRRLRGIERGEFARQTGFDVDELVGPALARFTELGLFEQTRTSVRLTGNGLLVSDTIWPHFLRV